MNSGKFLMQGKGLKIKDTPVTLPAYNYDVVTNLTDAENPEREEFTMDLRIVKGYCAG